MKEIQILFADIPKLDFNDLEIIPTFAAVLTPGVKSWADIKNIFIQTFGYPRDENSLTQHLVNLNLKYKTSENAFRFYENLSVTALKLMKKNNVNEHF